MMMETTASTSAAAATSGTPQANAPLNVTPSTSQGAGATSGTTTPGDWTAGFNDELKGYAQNKGWKDTSSLLESYRNLEKLQGVPQDRILKLPESMESPEARAIWEKLGAPKDAKDYALQVPKEFGGEKAAETMANVFHELGIPKSQAEKLVTKWAEGQAANIQAMKDAQEAGKAQAAQALKKEWGQAFERNMQIVDQAARNIGLQNDQVLALGQVLGQEAAAKLLHKLGTATSEATFVQGQQVGAQGPMTPDQAKVKRSELMRDASFTDRLFKGDPLARKQWDAVNQAVAPGEISL